MKTEIAIKFAEARRRLNLTQYDVAKLMLVTRGQYAKYENATKPRKQSMAAICRILRLDPITLDQCEFVPIRQTPEYSALWKIAATGKLVADDASCVYRFLRLAVERDSGK